jgi:DNA-binding transcriptional MerR regulator
MVDINGQAGALRRAAKSPEAFRTISEVATELAVPQHVLRFWESKFNQVRPLKRGGGRRYYRPEDVELLRRIRSLLYDEGYTIKGVQKLLRENGRKSGPVGAEPPPRPPTIGRAIVNERPALPLQAARELGSILDELRDIREVLKRRRR